jgi:hypothetical protein
LPFEAQRFDARCARLAEHQLDGAPTGGVAAAYAGVVLADAFFQVVGMAGVIREPSAQRSR